MKLTLSNNEMIKTTYLKGYEIQYNMLTLTGAWPKENPTVWYKLKGIIIFICVVLLGITMLMEVAKDIHDFAKLSEILYIMITVTTYIIKQVTLNTKSETFVYMINLLADPIFSTYPEDLDVLMVKRTRLTRFVSNFYRYLVLVCVILMIISPFVDHKPLPFPFDYELGPYKYFMYVFQAIAISMEAWNNPTIDSLAASLIGIAATHLEILGHKIIRARNENFEPTEKNAEEFSKERDRKVIQVLKQCIKHHLAIIEYIDCIDQIFSFCILMQFLASVIIICNTLFHFVLISIGSVQFFVLVTYMGFLILQLYMYCWFGNEVMWMSMKIVEASYFLNWYNCGDDVRKYLFIMMERAKRPLTITVFKFSVLSLNSFTTIIQWSYSYFALLMRLYRKKSK